jgi:hypothetical protein
VSAPSRIPSDFSDAYRAESALFIPEKAKSTRTPKRILHVTCFAFLEVGLVGYIGSTNVLEFEHHREVSSVSGEVILSHRGDATSICPITGQHSLPRNSDTRTAIDPPYG